MRSAKVRQKYNAATTSFVNTVRSGLQYICANRFNSIEIDMLPEGGNVLMVSVKNNYLSPNLVLSRIWQATAISLSEGCCFEFPNDRTTRFRVVFAAQPADVVVEDLLHIDEVVSGFMG